MDEPARQRARELANTPEFAKAQRQRKKVEALFAELKNQIGLRRLRLRQTEVRAGAVLPGSGGAEHQATGALPQPTDNTYSASHHLAELREKNSAGHTRSRKDLLMTDFFNTHACLRQLISTVDATMLIHDRRD